MGLYRLAPDSHVEVAWLVSFGGGGRAHGLVRAIALVRLSLGVTMSTANRHRVEVPPWLRAVEAMGMPCARHILMGTSTCDDPPGSPEYDANPGSQCGGG